MLFSLISTSLQCVYPKHKMENTAVFINDGNYNRLNITLVTYSIYSQIFDPSDWSGDLCIWKTFQTG